MNPSRSTGPRTKKGKARSSINATTHGLLGRFLVIGDERLEDYAFHFNGWVRQYQPRNPAEVQQVALAADLGWKLARAARLESAHFHSLVEEAVKKTPTFTNSALAQRALTALGMLIEAVDSRSTPPNTREAVWSFVRAAQGALHVVEEVGSSPEVVRLRLAIEKVDAEAEAGCSLESFKAVGTVAKVVAAAMAKKVRAYARQLKRVESIVAETLPVAEDKQAVKLTRYRNEISRALAQQLDLVERVTGKPGRRNSKGSSFREAIPTPKLRVVR